jgi:hypothetical protein
MTRMLLWRALLDVFDHGAHEASASRVLLDVAREDLFG